MIKYKGTTLYPPAFYDILDNIESISNYLVEAFTNDLDTDEILIHVSTKQNREETENEIKERFRAKLRVAPLVQFDTAENIQKIQLPETGRKTIKFIDNRKPSE